MSFLGMNTNAETLQEDCEVSLCQRDNLAGGGPQATQQEVIAMRRGRRACSPAQDLHSVCLANRQISLVFPRPFLLHDIDYTASISFQ